ncbi:MAG: PIN domain-containing protein [Nanoarchaeota archaeon]
MKIVVDTNVLFSFFWKESITRKLIINLGNLLLSPKKAKEELNKYSREIIQKAKINQKEFDNLLVELESYINFIELKDYNDSIENVKNSILDKEDYDFLALAYKNNYILWSNDLFLKRQELVKGITTKELLED